jgi:hypothetical protein
MPQRFDCLTWRDYWEQRGENPAEAMAKAPPPWWMVMGERRPDPPQRLQRRVRKPKVGDAPSRPEGETRRRLVRVGAQRQNNPPNPPNPPGGP